MIRRLYDAGRNVVVAQQEEDQDFGRRERIDVWWGGLKGNGGLMKIMAYLLQTSLRWQDAQVVLKMMVETEAAAADVRSNIEPIVQRMRTGAELEVIVSEGRSFEQVVHTSSRDADLIFLGMAAPDETNDFTAYYETLRAKTEPLPTTVFFLAAEPMAFEDMLID